MATNEINFGDLSGDENLKQSVTAFHGSVDEIASHLQRLCEDHKYEDMSLEERVEYDLLFAYSINALFWMYLRTAGIDPTQHALKAELGRVQTLSARAKQVKDRKTMPHVDVEAAKRFIRSGLWQPKEKDEQGEPKRKHIKFDTNDSEGVEGEDGK